VVAPVRAPELIGAGGWINADGRLSLGALAGKIVVLDFWSYCCINCLRVSDELRPIEKRFADEVIIVGVHSPKFPREHDHAAVVRAVARHGISHPVLDDPDLATWRQYGVRGWPTVIVVDPEGYVVGGISGEGCGPVLIQTIEGLIATHSAKATLVRDPIAGLQPPDPLGPAWAAVLAYPGKVAVEPGGKRLAIADTGHDRVVVCDLNGRIEAEFGALHAPQGVRFDGNRLVVCDTGADRVVAIALGGGAQTILATGLASPWDLAVDTDGSMLVAEAGRHRLWRVPEGRGVEDAVAIVVAGTGQENLVDGRAAEALLAQPSGVCVVPGGLAFVDAEASALRVLTDDGQIATLVGQGLFDWGASDGGPESSALQHPLGVAAGADGTVYVADTFNGLLRVWSGTALTASAGTLRTLAVSGLEEPGGIDVLPDGRLVVADTNNHRVVLVDPASGMVDRLVLDDTWIGTVAGDAMTAVERGSFSVPFELDSGAFELDFTVGPPVHIEVTAVPATLLGPGPRRWELDDASGTLEVAAGRAGGGTLLIEVAISVCDDLQCTVLRAKSRHDLEVTPAGALTPGALNPEAAAPAPEAPRAVAPAPEAPGTVAPAPEAPAPRGDALAPTDPPR
jgi:DNA-binding beta-propeller fold protein YncE